MSWSVDRYFGRRYDRARYNCWDLLREAWRDLTGEDLGDPVTALRSRRRFPRVAVPVSPSIVLMRQRRSTSHVGLFMRGRVLHIHPSGVRFERLQDATRGYGEVRFYAARHPDR